MGYYKRPVLVLSLLIKVENSVDFKNFQNKILWKPIFDVFMF